MNELQQSNAEPEIPPFTPDLSTVPSAERLITLDFIRGIAILGILFANITAFGQPFMAYFWPQAMVDPATASDKAFWVFQLVAVDHKFRGLFTILFGAGLFLFMERAWARGASRWLQFRRLLWLFAFGLAHYFLIWRGDILAAYALWGMVALLCLKWAARTQLIVGLLLSVVGSLFMITIMGGQYLVASNSPIVASTPAEARAEIAKAPGKILKDAKEETELLSTGSYPDIVANTVTQKAGSLLPEWIFGGITETFGFMLMGMALFRYGLFSGGMDPARMRKWGWTGLISGGLLTIPVALWAYREGFSFYATMLAFQGLAMLPRLAMVLGLLALLAAWAPKASHGWLGQRVVAAGRMAFSNYLGTSIVMVAIFQSWGLGLFGHFGRLGLFGFVVFGWILMLAWSKPWLENFRYGPLEWLWRCLTYGKIFPFRR